LDVSEPSAVESQGARIRHSSAVSEYESREETLETKSRKGMPGLLLIHHYHYYFCNS